MINKNNFLPVLIISFIATVQPAFATNIYLPTELLQGSTMEIEIPAHDITEVNGDFDGEPVLFYPTARYPKPDEAISRAEFLEMLFQNHTTGNVDTKDTKDFSDVEATSPYYKFIKKAAALGIVNGYEDGLFHPYDTITRGQMTKILTNTFLPETNIQSTSLTEGTQSPVSRIATLTFPDIQKDHVFYQYIKTAVNQGWFKGYPDGLFRPDRAINYLEAEIVIRRAANLPKPDPTAQLTAASTDVTELPPSTDPFIPIGQKPYFHAYTAIHRLSTPGPKELSLTIHRPNFDPEQKIIEIEILQRPIPIIRFSLPEEKTALFGDDAQAKTWTAVDTARANPSPTLQANQPFIIPTKGEITLGFGDKLYINGVYSGSHFGIDYANIEGTGIKAANNGIVTLSEYTPAFGNTVVLDHGHNIFSMYLHMNELSVQKDQFVKQGDIIGKMGSTGISSGPHLHYTLFVGNIIVDPDEWT